MDRYSKIQLQQRKLLLESPLRQKISILYLSSEPKTLVDGWKNEQEEASQTLAAARREPSSGKATKCMGVLVGTRRNNDSSFSLCLLFSYFSKHWLTLQQPTLLDFFGVSISLARERGRLRAFAGRFAEQQETHRDTSHCGRRFTRKVRERYPLGNVANPSHRINRV